MREAGPTIPQGASQFASSARLTKLNAGSGLQYAYRVSDIVRLLKEKGDWDPKNVRVTFVPDYEVGGRAGEAAPEVKVGQISVYQG